MISEATVLPANPPTAAPRKPPIRVPTPGKMAVPISAPANPYAQVAPAVIAVYPISLPISAVFSSLLNWLFEKIMPVFKTSIPILIADPASGTFVETPIIAVEIAAFVTLSVFDIRSKLARYDPNAAPAA